MVADAVAIAPEESEIAIDSLANKGSVSTVHKEYIEASNKEMSKAALGQTLTTDIGNAGSYAAAQAHNLVRRDLAAGDRHHASTCFNRLAAVWTFYNYGADVLPPAFEFVKDEDLLKDRAERDVKLYAIRWRPKKAYIEREYEIPEEDFDIFDIAESAGRGMEDRDSARRFASCPCGCEAHFATPYRGQSKPIERLFGTIIQLFSKSQDFYTGSNGEASERSRHA